MWAGILVSRCFLFFYGVGSGAFFVRYGQFNSIDNSTAFFVFAAEIPPQTKTPDSLCIRIRKVRSIVTWIIIQFLLFFNNRDQALVISKNDRLLDKVLDLLQPAKVLLLLLDVDVLGDEDGELGVNTPLGEV